MMMKKQFKSFFLLNFIFVTFISYQGCGVAKQAKSAANLAKCEFRIRSVENLNLAGVSIQNKNSIRDVSFADAAKIMTAIGSSTIPLTFQLNLEGKNPNPSPAGLNRIEWILFIDDIQMTTGSLNKAFSIPANNGTAIIPLFFNLDLKQILKGKSLDALTNFGFNLAGVGNKPTRFLLKLKPTIMIGNYTLIYPGYINVKTEFTSL